MSAQPREDRRLRKLTEICMTLSEVERTECGEHADFRVRGRVFAYFLKNHHGDGIVSVCCKSPLGENAQRATRDPRRFYLPAYLGTRGWFAMRLDLGNIDWYEVHSIVQRSYDLVSARAARAKPTPEVSPAEVAADLQRMPRRGAR
jgi:phosphoribosylglycinamide formyltransferase-1